MSDPVAELAAELADLKRQIRELQTAPRATKTSVSGGYTRWLPTNGAEYPKAYAGALGEDHVGFFVDQTDGDDGSLIAADLFMGIADGENFDTVVDNVPALLVANPDHQLYAQAIIDGAITTPLSVCAWTPNTNLGVDALARRVTTSGAYTEMARAILPLHTNIVSTGINVVLGSGVTSMDVRITIRGIEAIHSVGFSPTPAVTAVTLVEETGITANGAIADEWTVPDTLIAPNGSPVGLLCELILQARVSGGSGNAVASPYAPVFCRSVTL